MSYAPQPGAAGAGQALMHLARGERSAWLAPLAIAAGTALLAVGLTLPVIRIHKFVFWNDEYSVLGGIVNLFSSGNVFLGFVILAFSVFFPVAKLLALAWAWAWPMRARLRHRVLHWTSVLGRWSMLDVFVVAIIVVVLQSSLLTRAEPRPGIYVFAAAIVVSMLSAILVERAARRHDRCTESEEPD